MSEQRDVRAMDVKASMSDLRDVKAKECQSKGMPDDARAKKSRKNSALFTSSNARL